MRTLVLNAGFEPLSVVTFRRGLALVLCGKAVAVEVSGDPVRAVGTSFERPSVVVLTRYVKVPYTGRAPASRRGILRRDRNRCAYCGETATTIDHVVPRSRGGEDSWENLVACCRRCNGVKGSRTPREMGWRLRLTPKRPYGPAAALRGLESAVPEWQPYLDSTVAA